jgi:hypothetical protein
LNHETLVVRASCPLDIYLIIPRSTVCSVVSDRREVYLGAKPSVLMTDAKYL